MGYAIKFINMDDPKDIRIGQVYQTRAEAKRALRSNYKLMRYAQSVFGNKIVDSRNIRLIDRVK